MTLAMVGEWRSDVICSNPYMKAMKAIEKLQMYNRGADCTLS